MPAFLVAVAVSAVLLFSPSAPGTGPFEGSDKVVHGLIFLGLAVLGRRAGLPLTGLVPGLLLYAVGSELVQGLEAAAQSAILRTNPYKRTASATDGVADVTGLCAGVVLVTVWRNRTRRRR